MVCYTFLTAIIVNTLQETQNACRVKAEHETAEICAKLWFIAGNKELNRKALYTTMCKGDRNML